MKINYSNYFAGVLLFGSLSATAAPFQAYDARTLSMGGVGVAHGIRYAPYNNPALLPNDIQFVSWHLLASGGTLETDPDDFEKMLTGFQTGSGVTALGLEDKKFDEIKVSTLSVAIPSNLLGAGIFLNKSEFRNVRAFSGPSVLEKRGVTIVEYGVSFAQLLDEADRGFNSWAYGFSPKIVFAQAFSASDPLVTANTDISFSSVDSHSKFNFDVGGLKEFGRYKIAAVIKNIIPMKFDYSNGEKLEIKPQVRTGVSYVKRKRSWEVDLDLTPNKGVGFSNETLYLSMGTEYKFARYFAGRAGLRLNLKQDKDSMLSVGIGFGADYHADIALFVGDEEEGMIAQLGVDF